MKELKEPRNVLRIGKEITTIEKEDRPTKSEGIEKTASLVGFAMDLGFSVSVPIAGGALLGVYLDKRFGTSPKLTLSLLFLGLYIGIYSVYKTIKDQWTN